MGELEKDMKCSEFSLLTQDYVFGMFTGDLS